jgi:hypothetical protein
MFTCSAHAIMAEIPLVTTGDIGRITISTSSTHQASENTQFFHREEGSHFTGQAL